jgi:hypothetical protein
MTDCYDCRHCIIGTGEDVGYDYCTKFQCDLYDIPEMSEDEAGNCKAWRSI